MWVCHPFGVPEIVHGPYDRRRFIEEVLIEDGLASSAHAAFASLGRAGPSVFAGLPVSPACSLLFLRSWIRLPGPGRSLGVCGAPGVPCLLVAFPAFLGSAPWARPVPQCVQGSHSWIQFTGPDGSLRVCRAPSVPCLLIAFPAFLDSLPPGPMGPAPAPMGPLFGGPWAHGPFIFLVPPFKQISLPGYEVDTTRYLRSVLHLFNLEA